MAASKKSGTGPVITEPPKPSKVRAGMGDVESESIEVWKPEDEARARGLFQILDEQGRTLPGAKLPALDGEALRRIYRGMLRIRLVDEKMHNLQRQGRIGFYAEARGQEASVIGSVAALREDDFIVPSHREGGAALYRGLPLTTFVAQLMGNEHDIAKGRQMPMHVAAPRELAYLSMSSVVATQIPHAMGIAWAAKLRKKATAVLVYFGEGATSADDFHAGMNFAAAFKVPLVFLCENNGWAISTPPKLQTRAETFALKALAYGMPSIRVDGNDALAVYAATEEAVAAARRGAGPTLIEAVTYRLGSHSTSDDATRYRSDEELTAWSKKDPLPRFRAYLESKGLLDGAAHGALESELATEIQDAITAEESAAPPAVATMFEDVYSTVPAHLAEQRDELIAIRDRHKKPS